MISMSVGEHFFESLTYFQAGADFPHCSLEPLKHPAAAAPTAKMMKRAQQRQLECGSFILPLCRLALIDGRTSVLLCFRGASLPPAHSTTPLSTQGDGMSHDVVHFEGGNMLQAHICLHVRRGTEKHLFHVLRSLKSLSSFRSRKDTKKTI